MNKCLEIKCTHSATFAERYQINDNGSVSLIHNQKWHFCTTCDKVVHIKWIHWHEMRCRSFHELAKNCIAKGHYLNGTHSEGVACNM